MRIEPEHLLGRPADTFAVERSVRLQDVDAAGIAFFPRIIEYFNDTCIDFLNASGADVARALRERSWAAPVRHAEAGFLKPLRFGDRIEVAIVKTRVAESVAVFGYRIMRLDDGVVTGTGQTTHVFIDMQTFSRRAIPEPLMTALRTLA